MSEYKSVVQAVDAIRSFLNTHESNSTTCLWESDIDGAILKTDWGYFEEGLDEIRDYCERLDADRKTEPSSSEIPNSSTISKMEQVDKDINVRSKDEQQKDCNGCKFVGTYDTEFPCANCSRKTKDYYANDEPQTDCAWK